MREEYERKITGSCHPFGKTGQGVYLSSVVNLFSQGSLSESDRPQLLLGSEGHGLKEPGITGIKPEAGRSNLKQGEVPRKRNGGPLPILRSIRSGDLRLGVKSLTRPVIAGSSRNACQCSLA